MHDADTDGDGTGAHTLLLTLFGIPAAIVSIAIACLLNLLMAPDSSTQMNNSDIFCFCTYLGCSKVADDKINKRHVKEPLD